MVSARASSYTIAATDRDLTALATMPCNITKRKRAERGIRTDDALKGLQTRHEFYGSFDTATADTGKSKKRFTNGSSQSPITIPQARSISRVQPTLGGGRRNNG